uniref:Arb2 domain-containing protein n=1 Tax=Equus asinus asinus TaxID=83772 RepID=A0A8C4LS90_EQUAS
MPKYELSFQKFIEQSDLLEEFKYDFNEKAELRHTETQSPFVFNYYENVLERNSKRYQALGLNTRCWGRWQTRPT